MGEVKKKNSWDDHRQTPYIRSLRERERGALHLHEERTREIEAQTLKPPVPASR